MKFKSMSPCSLRYLIRIPLSLLPSWTPSMPILVQISCYYTMTPFSITYHSSFLISINIILLLFQQFSINTLSDHLLCCHAKFFFFIPLHSTRFNLCYPLFNSQIHLSFWKSSLDSLKNASLLRIKYFSSP